MATNFRTESEITSKWGEEINSLFVSICCITYNHEKFIEDTLNGFLFQQTIYPFEILIHDDASLDKTAQIIRRYEKQYPSIIKPIYQTTNQRSIYKGGMNHRFNYPRARGKYIALCEGDDYWTDPYKLQKQVNFLEENPQYSLCVGGHIRFDYINGRKEEIIKIPENVTINGIGYSFSLDEIKKDWITKTLTLVCRNDQEILKQLEKYTFRRDVHLVYHLLKRGKGFYFTEIMGVYRVHSGGVFSSQKREMSNVIAHYNLYKELFFFNKDEFTRFKYMRYCLKLVHFNLYQRGRKEDLKYGIKKYWEAVLLVRNIRDLRSIVGALLPFHLKTNFQKF